MIWSTGGRKVGRNAKAIISAPIGATVLDGANTERTKKLAGKLGRSDLKIVTFTPKNGC